MRRRAWRVWLEKWTPAGSFFTSRLAVRVMTLTQSHNRVESVGKWMFVSTTVVSTRSFFPVLDAEIHGRPDHDLVDGSDRRRGQPVEGAVEGVVLGDASGEKGGEDTQGDSVGNPLAQLPQVPVLDALQGEGAEDLLGIQSFPARFGILQSANQLLTDPFDELTLRVEQVRDGLQGPIEGDALAF